MKRIVKFILTLVIILSFISCGGKKTEKKSLDAPVIRIDNDVLIITEVKNAAKYVVYLDDNEYTTTLDLTVSLTDIKVGQHKIKVKAICSNDEYNDSDYSNELTYVVKEYAKLDNNINSLSRVGQYFEVLGNVNRKLPQISNGGLSFYPSYNVYLEDTSLNQAILDENLSLVSSNETYDSMDKDGKLYLNGQYINRDLYKHSASIGLYGNDLEDDEKAVVKKIVITSPKKIGNYLTGLYAPAGEVIKIEISSDDLIKTGGLNVVIGMTTGRNQSNDIEASKTYSRMPVLKNMMQVNNPTTYVGSYLGGPIYISSNKNTSFEVTISGAVEYLHYIDGLTSKEEFNRLENTSAPYLDFEVYDKGFRFSGPRYQTYSSSSSLDYENAVNTMKLWQNFNCTSRSVPHGMNSDAFITMLFDTYIKAGAAALAFVGADYATLPISWMRGTLDYKTFMITGGWGAIHEFNHHFQKFGCNGNSNEVSNNVMNFIEYILYTRITEYRNYSNISHGMGLDSHDDISYLNKYRNYIDSNTSKLIELRTEQGYAMLVENFGPELMLEVFRRQNGVTTIDAFYKALSDVIKLDFEFFFKELWHLEVSNDVINEVKKCNYPVYIPVGSYYSSSFNFQAINNESKHALPYICDKELIIDLGHDINTVTGFKVEILEVLSPMNGSLSKLNNQVYKYENHTNRIDSFKVKVKVYNDEVSEYVTITYDLNPTNQLIEVVTYNYDENIYSNISQAYENNFEGYKTVLTKYQSGQRISNISLNTIVVATGKFIIEEDGTYQVCYRGGRGTSMLYASVNDLTHFEKIGYIEINQSAYQLNAYANKKMVLHKGDIIYYKEYILPTSDNAFLEIGMSKTDNVLDVVPVKDSLFRGVNGNYDNQINYELRNNNIKLNPLDIKDVIDYHTLSATSPNFTPWDNQTQYGLDKIFDGDNSTYAHSARNITISNSNPIDLIISCSNMMTFNAITLYGSNKNQLPTDFEFYILVDGNYKLVNTFNNLQISKNMVTVLFDETLLTNEIKLHITKTSPQYLALSNVEIYEYHSFDSISLEDLNYYGNVSVNYEASPYGHVYKLDKDSYLEYEFEDSICLGLDILSSDYKVYIDDKLVNLDSIIHRNSWYNIYQIIDKGNHKIKILVNDGCIKIYDVLKTK